MSDNDARPASPELHDSIGPAHENLDSLYATISGPEYYADPPEGDVGLIALVKVVAGHPQHRGGEGLLLLRIRLRERVIYRVLECHADDEIGNVRESPDVVWRRFTGCGTTVFFESHGAHCARVDRMMPSRERSPIDSTMRGARIGS
jgi:hypothetical protein